jgi:gas vesicle protein
MMNNRIFYSQEAEAKAMRKITLLTVLWLTLGLGIGAIMALLYAPTAGKKTRRNLTKNFVEGLSSGQDALDPVIKRLEKEVGELRDTVEERIAKMR